MRISKAVRRRLSLLGGNFVVFAKGESYVRELSGLSGLRQCEARPGLMLTLNVDLNNNKKISAETFSIFWHEF